MSVVAKLGAFGLLLVVVLVASLSLGVAVGPLDSDTGPTTTGMQMNSDGGG